MTSEQAAILRRTLAIQQVITRLLFARENLVAPEILSHARPGVVVAQGASRRVVLLLLTSALALVAPGVLGEPTAALPDPTRPFNASAQTLSAPAPGAKPVKAAQQWQLQAIVLYETEKKAMINGKWLKESQVYQGWTLEQIDAYSLRLRQGKQEKLLRLNPPLTGSGSSAPSNAANPTAP